MRRALVPLLAALAVAAPLAVPAAASPGYPTQLDPVGADPDGFPALTDNPSAVQADNAGDLAVTTTAAALRYSTTGQLLQSPAPLANTAGYYVDGSGTSYVSVSGSPALHVYSLTGVPVKTLTTGGAETSMALDSASPYYGEPVLYGLHDGNTVDVIDPSSDPADPNGPLAATFPMRGSQQLLVAPDHSLYLLGGIGNQLYHYTQQGIFLGATYLNVPGETPGTIAALGMALDGAGTLFVTDPNHFRVVEFALDGTYLGSFGDMDTNGSIPAPAGPGMFDGPTSVTVDCHGRLFVLDVDSGSHKGRVLTFTGVAAKTGTCLTEPTTTTIKDGQAGILATDRAGNVWTSSYGQLDKIDVNGQAVTHWGSSSATAGQPGTWGVVGGLAVRASGNVLVGSYRYLQIDPSGTSTTTTYGPPKVIEFSAVGKLLKEWADSTYITAPTAIGVRPSDGEVFVANAYDQNNVHPPHLEEFNASFVHQRTIALPDLGGAGATIVSSTLGFDNAGDLVMGVKQSTGTHSTYYGVPKTLSQVVKVAPGAVVTTPLFAAPASTTGDNSVDSVLQLPDSSWVVTSRDQDFLLTTTAAVLSFSASGSPQRHWFDGQIAQYSSTRALLDCRGRLVAVGGSFTSLLRAPWVTGKACTWKATAVTGALISRTSTSLKVRAYSNPASQVTKLRILYGATSTHGKATAWITLPSDNVQLYRDLTISGLLTKHTYHYAVQVTNAAGTVTGADRTATTT